MSPVWKSTFCAFCRSPRKVYSKKHIGVLDVLHSAALGVLLSLLVWQELNPKVIPFSVTVLGITEMLIQLRWRISLPCQKCGFDPILYIKNPGAAAEKVKARYKERMSSPTGILFTLPVDEIVKNKRRSVQKIESKKQNAAGLILTKSNGQLPADRL